MSIITVPVAAASLPTANLIVLHELLMATNETLSEMPYARDGERDRDLDRVAAFVRIAEDMVARAIGNGAEEFRMNSRDTGPNLSE